jgi:hypothetical protein
MEFGNIPGLWNLRTSASETDQEYDKYTKAHRNLCKD